MRTIFILFPLIIANFFACSNEPNVTDSADNFFEKSSQQIDERIFVADLEAVHSQYLDSLEIYSPSFLKSDQKYLFLSEGGQKKINAIYKNDFSKAYSITVDEGRGPGELNLFNHFDVSSDYFALLDNPGLKILILDHDGNFISEFFTEGDRPARVAFIGNNQLLIYSPITDSYMFKVIDLEGNIISRFTKLDRRDGHNALKFTGRVIVSDNHIYFAGHSESILKKYSSDGTLLFSKTTIDDFPSEHNYVTFQTGEGAAGSRYSPGALYAFFNFEVWDDYIVTVVHHNNDPEFKYLDIYSSENGQYLGTLTTEGFPNDITIDDDYLYVRESLDGVRTLKKYPNELRQIFSNI